MELTAEYLESKGWEKTYFKYEKMADVNTFCLMEDKKGWQMFINGGTYSQIAKDIKTTERFDTLWNAITTQD